MKKIITEELERIKLMMNYNPKKTLTENTILMEQAWKAVVEDLGRVVARDETAVLKSLENAANEGLINLKTIKNEAGVTLTKMSEVLEALKAGTLGPSGTGQVAKGLFLKGATSEMRIAGAEAITGMGKFAEKFAGKTKEEIVQALEQSGKWSKADAEVLADTYLKKGGKTPIKPEPVKPEPVKPEPVKTDPPINPPKPTWWESSWNWLTKTKWGRRIMIAGGLTAAYLLWKKFFGDDDDLPICLKNLVKDEQEFQNYLTNGYVVYQGAYKFYPDGKVELTSPDGNTKEGTWEFENGQINMDFDGIKNSIPCKDAVMPTPEPTPTGGGGGGGGTYKNCTDFPFIKFCKNPKIAEVQECLGGLSADGKFGPKTEAALEKAGYGKDISQDDYNKIMEKCGRVQPSPDNTQTSPETSSDMSNKPE